MNTSDRIKKVRNFRKMTMKELGVEMHYPYKGADVRIAQYESGKRSVRREVIDQLAEILKVAPESLIGPQGYSDDDVMRILFDLEEEGYEIDIHRKGNHIVVEITADNLREPLEEWKRVKAKLAKERITQHDYIEWKLCWNG